MIDHDQVHANIFFGCIVVVVMSVVLMIGKCILADGRADYCVVHPEVYHVPSVPDVVVYSLEQHVPWRPDRFVGQNFKSLDEAKAAATAIGCEIR